MVFRVGDGPKSQNFQPADLWERLATWTKSWVYQNCLGPLDDSGGTHCSRGVGRFRSPLPISGQKEWYSSQIIIPFLAELSKDLVAVSIQLQVGLKPPSTIDISTINHS
jgi:hypothetical protein